MLHFVAYVPPTDQRPLRFLHREASGGSRSPEANGRGGDEGKDASSKREVAADSFWMPAWGVVYAVNQWPLNQASDGLPGEGHGGGYQSGVRSGGGGATNGGPAVVDLGLDEMSRLAQIVVAGLRALFESDIRSSILSKYGSREQGGDQALGAEPTEASVVEEGFAAGGGRKAAVGQLSLIHI